MTQQVLKRENENGENENGERKGEKRKSETATATQARPNTIDVK